MPVIICPGIHDTHLTQSFLEGLLECTPSPGSPDRPVLVFPAQDYPPYCAVHILQFLRSSAGSSVGQGGAPVIFISFSAGVAGAIGAAWAWQLGGGKVKAFIALDGWGVPLYGNFPIHRLSHDYFTYWSSALLGSGEESFYADPPVEHLALWRSPQTAVGVSVGSVAGRSHSPTGTTAAEFVNSLLQRYS